MFESQTPVVKSRAMHWTVKDPSGRPWGLLDPTSQTHMDMIQTGLLAQDAFSRSNVQLMKKLLETPI